MVGNLVAARYAEALLNVAKERGEINNFKQQLRRVLHAISNSDLKSVLGHPKIPAEAKKAVVERVFKNQIPQDLLNFLFVLIDRKRIHYFKQICAEYETLANDEMNILPVEVITAVEMDDAEKRKLAEILEDKFEKNIHINNKVDKGILGGLVIKTRDKIIDASLLKSLKTVKQNVFRILGV